jgi:hypothetical protein
MSSPYQAPASAADVARGLTASVIDAVSSGDPATLIDCPGYGPKNSRMSVADYLADSFAGQDQGSLPGLVALWAGALKSSDVALRISAMALLSQVASAHVAFHLDDAMAADEVPA